MTTEQTAYAALQEIIAHLGASSSQAIDRDNPSITGHVRDALEIARQATQAMRAASN